MNTKSVLLLLNPLSLPRLEAILAYARRNSWSLILEDRLPPDGINRVDGAIVSLRGREDHICIVRQLKSKKKPVVDLTIACPKVRLPRVISDHRALGRLGAQHFLERAFVNFAWYASSSSHVHDLRYQGYADALSEKGIVVHRITDPISQLPTLPRPLAVLAFDESDAATIVSTCIGLKIVIPNDVAVLGIGNDPFLCENGEIMISSVDQNLGLAATRACEFLDTLMRVPLRDMHARSELNQTILIPPAGVIPRGSTETLAHPHPIVREALIYIHRHISNPFGAAETADAVGVPRSTLDHLFNDKIGHSIGREILNQRMLRARRLLKDQNIRLNKIAAACGFCNASYFTNTFSRETGMTPKTWRNKMLHPQK